MDKTTVTKVKLSDDLNIFDWFRTKDIISQIAEKARSSVDSVIATLDPGMREYLYSGGNINIIVVCDSGSLVSPVRDAFQSVFGRATVTAARYSSPESVDDHPVKLAHGFKYAKQVARERMTKLRLDTSSVPQNQVVVAIQPCIVNLSDSEKINPEPSPTDSGSNLPQEWFLTYCMILEDPVLNTTLTTYSQFIPLDPDIDVRASKETFKEPLYTELGYATSLTELMNDKLGIKLEDCQDSQESQWLHLWAGLDEIKVMHDLSLTLAHTYKRKWNECLG